MKTKIIVFLSALSLVVFAQLGFSTVTEFGVETYKESAQEGLVVFAAFDGKEDYGYNFVVKGKDGAEHTLTFHKVKEEVLKAFDLNSENLVGTKFKITFNKEIKITKDEHGNDDEEEVNTITNLERV